MNAETIPGNIPGHHVHLAHECKHAHMASLIYAPWFVKIMFQCCIVGNIDVKSLSVHMQMADVLTDSFYAFMEQIWVFYI